jgi:hypothetical protein
MKTVLIVIALMAVSCKDNDAVWTPPIQMKLPEQVVKKDAKPLVNEVLSTDVNFYSDSVFKGHKKMLQYYFKKYCRDLPCSPMGMYQDKKDIKEYFEGIKYIGRVKNKKDSVFVLNPIIYCQIKGEDDMMGKAYYFTDTSLPRLQTDSNCCHPENLFPVGDIDEDGVAEVGLYYSSCSSRYKSLRVYTLKNNNWKKVGECVYDLMYHNETDDYKPYIKKTGKSTFKMLEITDITEDTTRIGKPNWIKFSI